MKWNNTLVTVATLVETTLLVKKLKEVGEWECIREGNFHGKQVDLLLRDHAGKVITLEVARSARHEAHNVLNCLQASGEEGINWSGHVVVATSTTVLKDVKKKFDGFPELANNPRIELLVLSRALSKKWIPGEGKGVRQGLFD